MKAKMLKIAGVKSEKEFYKKFPTEEAFMEKHGEAFKKAFRGIKLEKAQSGMTKGTDLKLKKYGYDNLITVPNSSQFIQGDVEMNSQFFAENPYQTGPQNPPYELYEKEKQPWEKTQDMIGMGVQATSTIGQNIDKVKNAVKQLKEAKLTRSLAPVVAQAASTRPEQLERRYVRPENVVNTGEEFFPIYGVGTNVLAKNGAEIANTFAPNTLYDNLEYEPLDDSKRLKQFEGGGNLLSFAPEIVNSLGDIIAAPFAIKAEKLNKQSQQYLNKAAFQSGAQNLQMGQYQAHMKDGGSTSPYEWVSHTWQPQKITTFGEHKLSDLLRPPKDADMLRAGGNLKDEYTSLSARAMSTERPMMQEGGELETHWGGYAEPMSYNPYLPDGGETVMFRGQSHDESDGKGNTGIGITYGDSPVEVERGEPAMKMKDGSGSDSSLVVFGNLKVPKGMLPGADGLNFKKYVANLSKEENKANKTMNKAVSKLGELEVFTPFDSLTFNTLKAQVDGNNQKLKDIAQKKMDAAALQSAMNDTVEEFGLKTTDRGTIMAEKGANIPKAQGGDKLSGVNDKLKNLYKLITSKYSDAIVTSGLRPGAVTSKGRRSTHGVGGGMDVAFTSIGNKAYNEILNDPNVVKYMLDNNITVIDEYDPNIKSLTGATDDHLHFGFDKGTPTADKFRNDVMKMYPNLSSNNQDGKYSYKSKNKGKINFNPIGSTDNQEFKSKEEYKNTWLPKVESVFSDRKLAEQVVNAIEGYTGEDAGDVVNLIKKGKTMDEKIAIAKKYSTDYKPGPYHDLVRNIITTPPATAAPAPPAPATSAPQASAAPIEEKKTDTVEEIKGDKFNLAPYYNALLPFIRPSNAEQLRAEQLAGEMYAMATNQLEGVKAQTYQPQLSVPYDISLQDILNENEATYRGQQRMFGYNPALQSQLAAQKYGANQKVLGEQFRMNQAMKDQTYRENRNILNDAQLKNLAILDQQYVRQEEAKSRTKGTTQAALNSIASKFAQNRLENRTLQVMENMYNYRYGPNFRAINANPLVDWDNMIANANPNQLNYIQSSIEEKKKKEKPARNGSIVKALKNI